MLTEETKLVEVSILPETNTINVCWQHRILRDGEIISAINHRCAYSSTDKSKFEIDLGVAATPYVNIMGWI